MKKVENFSVKVAIKLNIEQKQICKNKNPEF